MAGWALRIHLRGFPPFLVSLAMHLIFREASKTPLRDE